MTKKPMNILQAREKIVTDLAHKVKEYEDSAVYGYVIGMIEMIESRGEDPRNYEMVFVESEYPMETENGFKIVRRLRVRKFKNDDEI